MVFGVQSPQKSFHHRPKSTIIVLFSKNILKATHACLNSLTYEVILKIEIPLSLIIRIDTNKFKEIPSFSIKVALLVL